MLLIRMFKKLVEKRFRKRMINEADQFLEQGVHDINNREPIPKFSTSFTVSDKVKDILSKLTLDEKINMLSGENYMGIKGISRLKLRNIWCSDSSSGIHNFGRATAFPASISMTASWNRELI